MKERAVIRWEDCTGCGKCVEVCRFDAIIVVSTEGASYADSACRDCSYCERSCSYKVNSEIQEMASDIKDVMLFKKFVVDPTLCDACGECVKVCPENAIDFFIL